MERCYQDTLTQDRPALPTASTSLGGWTIPLAALLLALATAAAFSSGAGGAFIYDDYPAILENPTIRHLWPIWTPLSPPGHGATVTGRPLLNFSLAINYAIGGREVWSYHVVNVVIHMVGALLLFGVVRRTFLLPRMRDRWGEAALPLAFIVALLWAIHPLQTESVTYIVQRAESLMGMFYLLTLYGFIRGASAAGSGVRGQESGPDSHPSSFTLHPSSFILPPVAWYAASVLACLLGMATKEVMASAPLIVLLYDRTFCAGSFRDALRRRYGFYTALAGTWALLGWLALWMSPLATGGGPGTQHFTWWSYLLTQPGVIVHYLRLAVWPSGLCLYYGWPAATTVAEVLPPAIAIVSLLAATVWALVKRPAWGFLGAWFFAILAPTSSVVALGQAAFEHRMYLPLAAVVMAVAAGGYLAGRRLAGRWNVSARVLPVAAGLAAALAGIALGLLTIDRNLLYGSPVAICATRPQKRRAAHTSKTILASHCSIAASRRMPSFTSKTL